METSAATTEAVRTTAALPASSPNPPPSDTGALFIKHQNLQDLSKVDSSVDDLPFGANKHAPVIRDFVANKKVNVTGNEPAAEPGSRQRIIWSSVLTNLQREKRLDIARREEHYIRNSLIFFTSSSKVREYAIKLTEWPAFDKLVLLFISLNCVILMLEDPICRCSKDVCGPWDRYQQSFYSWDCSDWPAKQSLLDTSEIVFTCFFTFEMMVKILARGFVLHKHAYLREPWNWLDFVVVIASLLSFLPNIDISVLRTFRVLRPLRTLSRIKSMKPILITFARSLPSIGNVFTLLAFFMGIYGILSIELMSGALRGYCFFDPRPGRNNFTEAALSRLISQQTPFLAEQFNVLGGWNVYVQTCRPEDEQAFGPDSGFMCPPMAIDGETYATTCSTKKWCGTDWCLHDWNSNPYDLAGGYISYDNIFSSLVTNFQAMTFASWDDLLYRVSNGGNVWLSRMYHTSWVFIGAFVVVQLALAVLAVAFVQAQEEQTTERAREALYEESILEPPGHDSRAQTHKRAANRRMTIANIIGVRQQGCFSRTVEAVEKGWAGLRRWARRVALSGWFQRSMTLVIIVNSVCLGLDFHDQDLYEDSICQRRCKGDPRLPAAARSRCQGPLYNRSWTFDGQGGGKRPDQALFCFVDRDAEIAAEDWAAAGGGLAATNCSLATDINSCAAAVGPCGWVRGRCMLGLYSTTSFAANVTGTWTVAPNRSSSITLRDLCGSISDLNNECPNYPTSLNDGLEVANYLFTLVFVIELLVKLLAMGFLAAPPPEGAGGGGVSSPGYFNDMFNWLDFAIVIASAVESLIKLSSGGSKGGAGGALTSLRALRVMRIFRLVRSWKGMQKVLATLAKSNVSIWPLLIMILLFMYIFALLGIQLFGGKFRYAKTDVPRSNFDSFLPSALGHGALLAIFQMMSLENWNNIMFCSMVGFEATPVYALFFLVVMLIGNYMFMNLFISILLQNIGQDSNSEDKAEEESREERAGPAARLLDMGERLIHFLEDKPLTRAKIMPEPPPPPPPAPAKSESGDNSSLSQAGADERVEAEESEGRRTAGADKAEAGSGAGSLGRPRASLPRAESGGLAAEAAAEAEARLSEDGGSPTSRARATSSFKRAESGAEEERARANSLARPGSRASRASVSEARRQHEAEQAEKKRKQEEERRRREEDPDGDMADDLVVRGSLVLLGRKVDYSLADHNAFFVLSPAAALRRLAAVVARHPAIDALMLTLILASSLTLLIEQVTRV